MRMRAADAPNDRHRFVVLAASVLLILVSAGGMFLIVVALKDVAREFGWPRAVPSFAFSLQYIGSGFGGILMGYVLDRVGMGVPAVIGSVMAGTGAILVSGIDSAWQLYLIYAFMFGLAGQGSLSAPAMANIARWFDKRRGMAIGMVAGGQSLAGIVWPPIFGIALESIGWRQTFLWYGVFALIVMLPLSAFVRRKPPAPVDGETKAPAAKADAVPAAPPRPKLSPNAIQWTMCGAIIGCCVAMSLPLAHLVSHVTDQGHSITSAAEVFSVTLLAAFISRSLFVGLLADRYGGLMALFVFSAVQAVTLAMLTMVDSLWALYVVGALYGLGYGGIFPVYSVAIREYLPISQIGWRTGVVFLFGAVSMGFGSWMGGYLFDLTGSYTLPFLIGAGFNAANLVVVVMLMARLRRSAQLAAA